jgi:D-3-phosphoglycerate dehydrogenase
MTQQAPIGIVIADKVEQEMLDGLQACGEVIHDAELGPDTMPAAIKAAGAEGASVLVVRSTKVPASVIEACPSLRLIVRAGSGYDNIDTKAADDAGVMVCNCPGMNAVAVAELTIGHLVSLDRRLPEQDAALKAGQWNKKAFSKARGLKGRRLLVIGTGSIGTEVIRRAQAFGMEVWAQSRSLREDTARALGITPVSYTRDALHQALGEVDAVSVHVAATPDTRDLCNADFFAAMREGAYFINTSRGELVDEAALIDAVRTRGIRAALDVYRDQPSFKDGPWSPDIVNEPGVQCSHHVGASTDQAQLAVAMEAVRLVEQFAAGNRPDHVVNSPGDAVGVAH